MSRNKFRFSGLFLSTTRQNGTMPESATHPHCAVATTTTAVARGLALFVAGFTLLNLAGEAFHRGFDASIWWIDLRPLSSLISRGLLLLSAVVLLDFVRNPGLTGKRRLVFQVTSGTLTAIALRDAATFYNLIDRHEIQSSFPMSVSLVVATGFGLLLVASLLKTAPDQSVRLRNIVTTATFGVCLVAFPLLQIFCFGWTDYRRSADVAVVFGCRVYRNGEPSEALIDRVHCGVDLYRAGLCSYLLMSGGPGPGETHETTAMKRLAVDMGVPADRVLIDELGLSTDETVTHTLPMIKARGFRRVLAVSHYFHLPRIKLTYSRAGLDVFTVPTQRTRGLWRQEFLLIREVAALWAYYARPLTGL